MAFSYNFSGFEKQISEIESRLKNQLASIRTGRASPAIVEEIKVDYYGSKTPIKHAAAITVEDAKTLRIQPWDPSSIPAIEKAIRASSLGVNPVVDKDGVRIILPELTQERRQTLFKLVAEKLEETRIALRLERDKMRKDIQEKEKGNEISEDEKFRAQENLQKIVDEANKRFGEIVSRKEKEIMT